MNYPYNVSGGVEAFFSDFEYRFSDQELLFLRHAPQQFVQMGNAAWFDHHGFEWAEVAHRPDLKFTVRVNKGVPSFEFMEPVSVELKLENISKLPIEIMEDILSNPHELTVVIKKLGKTAKLYRPFMQKCNRLGTVVLHPKTAIYESVFISAGTCNWYIDEPGDYIVQASLKYGDSDIVSNELRIRVNPPRSFDESMLAQDFFSDEVARVLQFDGSMALKKGNEYLHLVLEKMPSSNAAVHANVALAMPHTKNFKYLNFQSGTPKLKVVEPDFDTANKLLHNAFRGADSKKAASSASFARSVSSLGHIDANLYIRQYCKSLQNEGKVKEAVEVAKSLHREFAERNVIQPVLNEIEKSISAMEKKKLA
jgi:hypothetical protein